MLKLKPLNGKPGAFFDLFFGCGVRSSIEDGLLKLCIKCPLDGDVYERVQAMVMAAQADDNIKAIFFDVDSPGGYVAECFETAGIVKASAKPTVTYVAGYSASAMYAISAATQKIFAHPSAFIGSIGVVNFLPKMDNGTVIVATKSPNKINIGSDPEGVARERALMDSTYEQFVGNLSAYRGVPVERIEAEWGKGGLLTAAQALSVGMIDEIGDREKALTFAKAFTAAPPATETALETEAEEVAEEENEVAAQASATGGPQMALKDWFAIRKNKAEMTPEEKSAAEEMTPDWLKENKPEVYDAIFNAGKEAAGTEAAAAKEEEEKLTALADEENTDEKAVVASLRSGKIKAKDFTRMLLEARKNPSETELARRAKARIEGDGVDIHQGAESGANRAGDVKAQAAAIIKHLQRDRTKKAGK